MNRKVIYISIAIVLLIILVVDVQAQCPMCRMSAESNLREGGTEGAGLNKGILYMLCMPYLLVSTLGYIWWKNRRNISDEIFVEPFSEN